MRAPEIKLFISVLFHVVRAELFFWKLVSLKTSSTVKFQYLISLLLFSVLCMKWMSYFVIYPKATCIYRQLLLLDESLTVLAVNSIAVYV